MKKQFIDQLGNIFAFGLFFCLLSSFGVYFMLAAHDSGIALTSTTLTSHGGEAGFFFLCGLLLFLVSNVIAGYLLYYYRCRRLSVAAYITACLLSCVAAVIISK